jgi:AraC family transcriptional regulator
LNCVIAQPATVIVLRKAAANVRNYLHNNCSGKHQTVDVFTFILLQHFLHQFVHNVKLSNRKDEVLAFKHPHAFTKVFPLCNRKVFHWMHY